LQSEGLFLLFERNQKYHVELLPIESEIASTEKRTIEKFDVLIHGNLENTENTTQTLKNLQSINPGIKIITIGKDYDQELIQALTYSNAFLDASADFNILVKAISKVISEEFFIDPYAANTYIKLLKDEKLYNELVTTNKDLQNLVIDIQMHPERFIHFSVFGAKTKGVPLNQREELKLRQLLDSVPN
jgi:phospholipid/cholesterol/gamma-HCH transport system substrate-binding protein